MLIALIATGVIREPTEGIVILATKTVPPLAGKTFPLHTFKALYKSETLLALAAVPTPPLILAAPKPQLLLALFTLDKTALISLHRIVLPVDKAIYTSPP